ncbi:MAG: hypothetical protein ABI671_07885 [Burkholderiales bacterium]
MNNQNDLPGAATTAVTLLAAAAFLCIVTSATPRAVDATPTALALAGQVIDTNHPTGGLK